MVLMAILIRWFNTCICVCMFVYFDVCRWNSLDHRDAFNYINCVSINTKAASHMYLCYTLRALSRHRLVKRPTASLASRTRRHYRRRGSRAIARPGNRLEQYAIRVRATVQKRKKGRATARDSHNWTSFWEVWYDDAHAAEEVNQVSSQEQI